MNASAQRNVAVGRFHLDAVGIKLRASGKGTLAVCLYIGSARPWLDPDRVHEALHPDKVFDGILGRCFLILPLDFTIERYPTIFNRDLDMLVGNVDMKAETVLINRN